MDSENINKGNPLLLSKIADLLLGNTKIKNEMKMENDMEYFVQKNGNGIVLFKTGSFAEGFYSIASDIDSMIILNSTVVVTPDDYEQASLYDSSQTVLMMRGDGCRPGYTKLQVIYTSDIGSYLQWDCIIPQDDLMYVSSSIFRENLVEAMKNPTWISHGPCLTTTRNSVSADIAPAFHCPGWPDDAKEWPNRTRVFGWPPETLINKIVKDGCHVVPIGDKCCEDTLLQWRISFATAERQLIHSINHTQLQVYALLKYMLNQMKYRLKQDIGENDILCSYFIKTLVFHAVENSPQTLWQEKNIFVCFWLCFTMLLDWVHVGYCPNYFILSSNMFHAKVHGENQMRLLQILHEVHQMTWRCFSVGTFHWQPIWDILNSETTQDVYSAIQKNGLPVNISDGKPFCERCCLFDEPFTLECLKPSLVLLSKAKSELEEICAYKIFAELLFYLAE